MAPVKLKKLLARNPHVAEVLAALEAASGAALGVEDLDGALLLGNRDANAGGRYPITVGESIVGWVVGGGSGQIATSLIGELAGAEDARRAMAAEVLEAYRELNLVYNLSEKLGASLDIGSIGQITLEEASRLIETTGGSVILFDEPAARWAVAASYSRGSEPVTGARLAQSALQSMAESDKAEIVNDVRQDTRFAEIAGCSALLYAPLKAKGSGIGVLLLTSSSDASYSAAHLKLLSTVASLAAPAIEHALLHEKTLQEAREREERLQRQVQELRIELNEVRQERQVIEITESDYFQRLREQTDELRGIIDGS